MKKDLDKFSVIRSKFEIFEDQGINYIKKEITLTSLKDSMCSQVKGFTVEYISKIIESGIPLPDIKEHYIKNNKIFFICKYMGENIHQLFIKESLDFIKNKELLSQITDIIKKAQKSNIYIDPHPKNFVLKNNKLYYVDFSPPYLPEYNNLVIANTEEKHKGLVKKNLEAFSPNEIGYHFAGDLLKEDNKFGNIMLGLYSYFKEERIINGSFEEFIKKANEIKNIELERVRRNVFLI